MAPARTTKSGEANLRSIAARGVVKRLEAEVSAILLSREAISNYTIYLGKLPGLDLAVSLPAGLSSHSVVAVFWNCFPPCFSHPRKCASDSFGAEASLITRVMGMRRSAPFAPVRSAETNKLWNMLL